mmetsp:Transcript_47063/g.119119  ORF Transcript_47063/g.119119 Transcript_47063/m.119119 type:complete len:257 (-) Transcript_47063:277-1047(-)
MGLTLPFRGRHAVDLLADPKRVHEAVRQLVTRHCPGTSCNKFQIYGIELIVKSSWTTRREKLQPLGMSRDGVSLALSASVFPYGRGVSSAWVGDARRVAADGPASPGSVPRRRRVVVVVCGRLLDVYPAANAAIGSLHCECGGGELLRDADGGDGVHAELAAREGGAAGRERHVHHQLVLRPAVHAAAVRELRQQHLSRFPAGALRRLPLAAAQRVRAQQAARLEGRGEHYPAARALCVGVVLDARDDVNVRQLLP